MKEYIERENAIRQARIDLDLINKSCYSVDEIIDFLSKISAADVVEVKHAFWQDGNMMQTCSACKYRGKRSYRFCPNCGAKMDGGVNDGKAD